MKHLIYFLTMFLVPACSSTKTTTAAKQPVLREDKTFVLTDISTDATYGLSPKNPVETGGGPINERRYLNALAGPNGEPISYYRAGSCCPVKSEKGLMGMAMLDLYRVTWENSKDTVSIYINMYDVSELKAPMGFTIRK